MKAKFLLSSDQTARQNDNDKNVDHAYRADIGHDYFKRF